MLIGASRHARLRGVVAVAVLLALAGMVSACGQETVQTVGGGPTAKLECTQAVAGHSVDVVNIKLTCKVSDAASGDTMFKLRYSVKNGDGSPRSFDAICFGALKKGVGSCIQIYELVVPFDDGSASVQGELLPSQHPLGPLPLPPLS